MNVKKFSDAMSELDTKYVEEALNYDRQSKRPVWIKWAVMAACLCLVLGGIAISQIPGIFPDHGAGIDPGGTHPDGVDPIIASVAVYPATEKIEDVADATYENISEADAYGFDPLGKYLPASLPDGYHFGKASLYETTMKDGTRYYLLRVQYTTDNSTAQANTEEDIAADPNTLGKSFAVFVMNYEPATEKQIYAPADMTARLLEEIGGSTFHISYGHIYVGISPDTATSDDILAAVTSIG